jgi:hypothetical protein
MELDHGIGYGRRNVSRDRINLVSQVPYRNMKRGEKEYEVAKQNELR